jgi:NAD(P)-dependent dehydrogenase (short-subunit alcohol dehydrogenase family)
VTLREKGCQYPSMTTSLVTGAGRGIGLSLCSELLALEHHVIAACRRPTPALQKLGARIEAGAEVSSDTAMADLAARLAGTPIDWLIANAGVLRDDPLEKLDFEQLRQQYEINALGALRTVAHLLPNLKRGSKIALITSRMGSIGDNSSGGYYGYRMSKAALNAAGVSLAQDLRPRGIAVALLHPGYVQTDMTGKHGSFSPEEAARLLVQRIDALNLQTTGSFWHADGERLPW